MGAFVISSGGNCDIFCNENASTYLNIVIMIFLIYKMFTQCFFFCTRPKLLCTFNTKICLLIQCWSHLTPVHNYFVAWWRGQKHKTLSNQQSVGLTPGQNGTTIALSLGWDFKDSGHYWELSKTSLHSWCISTYA